MNASVDVGRAALRTAMAVLLGLIGLGSMIGPAASSSALAAQKTGLVDDGTYVSDTSGEEITWGGDWTFDEKSSFVEDGVERVALTGDAGLLDVIYFPPGLDLVETRDDLFDLLTDGADDTLQIDRGDYAGSSGEVSYSLDKVLVDDTELAMFTLLMERKDDTFVTVFYSTPRLFAQGMESAQENIEIEGSAIFQGIQPAGLKDALDGAPSLLDGATTGSSSRSTQTDEDETETPQARTDETETPEARTDETETPEARNNRTDETETPEARGNRADDETPEATETEESGSSGSKKTSTGASDDYADLGVTGEGAYESPQYGIPVEWSDAWTIDETLDQPVVSDTSTGTDQIGLVRTDYEEGDTSTYGGLSVRFFEAGPDDTTESVVDYWTSKDYLNGGAGDGSTVLLADSTKTEGSVVLISELDSGEILVQYLSVFFLDRGKTAVMIEFYATDTSIADAYADAEDGVTVDGQPILTIFNAKDIEDALADQ